MRVAPTAWTRAQEIDPTWFDGATTVGVTSGASVPDVLVNDVLDSLRELGFGTVEEVTTAEETLVFALPPELRRDLKAASARLQPTRRRGRRSSEAAVARSSTASYFPAEEQHDRATGRIGRRYPHLTRGERCNEEGDGRSEDRVEAVAWANDECGNNRDHDKANAREESQLAAEEHGLTESKNHRDADGDRVDPEAGQ